MHFKLQCTYIFQLIDDYYFVWILLENYYLVLVLVYSILLVYKIGVYLPFAVACIWVII